MCIDVHVCVCVVHRWPDDLGEGHLRGGNRSQGRQKTNQDCVDSDGSRAEVLKVTCVIFPHHTPGKHLRPAHTLSFPRSSNCLLQLILGRPGVISYTNKVPLKEIREICMNFSLIYLIVQSSVVLKCDNKFSVPFIM